MSNKKREKKRETKLDLENFEKKNQKKNPTQKISTSNVFKMQMKKFYCSIVLLCHGPRPNDLRLRNFEKKIEKKKMKFFKF